MEVQHHERRVGRRHPAGAVHSTGTPPSSSRVERHAIRRGDQRARRSAPGSAICSASSGDTAPFEHRSRHITRQGRSARRDQLVGAGHVEQDPQAVPDRDWRDRRVVLVGERPVVDPQARGSRDPRARRRRPCVGDEVVRRRQGRAAGEVRQVLDRTLPAGRRLVAADGDDDRGGEVVVPRRVASPPAATSPGRPTRSTGSPARSRGTSPDARTACRHRTARRASVPRTRRPHPTGNRARPTAGAARR